MIFIFLEVSVWLGIMLLMVYVASGEKRWLIKRLAPAIDYTRQLVDGEINRRFFYLGGPYRLNGSYRGHTISLSISTTHCNLQLHTEGSLRTLPLDFKKLLGDDFDRDYIRESLDRLTSDVSGRTTTG
ncbi:MAG: hypothetical protein GY696_00535 [Gammaproteobacteria bacterium]|nr:hypothetical protein [Gammaproteobacteria bacterium]